MKRSLTDCDPPPKKGGLKAWRKWLGDFYSAWRASRPLRSETCDLHESPDGTQLLPSAQKGSAQTSAPNFFQLTNASTGSTKKIKVTASDINGNAIEETTFTVTATGKVWAKVTDDADFLETAWVIQNGATVPDNDGHNGYEPIGWYDITDGVLTFGNYRYGPVFHLNAISEHLWG